MVDRDLKGNGAWFGKLGVGREWVLGDVVSRIPRIRGVFSRVERQTHHAGKRTTVTYIYELWIVDDCQRRQVTSLKSKRELEEAMDCLRQRAPAALFGAYDSKEYQDLVCVKEDMQQYTQERAYRKRAAQVEEQNRKEQEGLAPEPGAHPARRLGDLPDHSGRSSPAAASAQPDRGGRPLPAGARRPLPGGGTHLQPLGLPPRRGPGAGAHSAGGIFRRPRSAGPVRLDPDVSTGEAETVLRNWLRGEVPSLDGWTRMERSGRTWRPLDGGDSETTSVPPQPHPDWLWSLNIGGGLRSNPAWQDIEAAAAGADPGGEQLPDPGAGGARKSGALLVYPVRHGPTRPDRGRYFVEIGASSRAHRLWERMVPDVQAAVEVFFTAYQQRSVDGSGFRETEF